MFYCPICGTKLLLWGNYDFSWEEIIRCENCETWIKLSHDTYRQVTLNMNFTNLIKGDFS